MSWSFLTWNPEVLGLRIPQTPISSGKSVPRNATAQDIHTRWCKLKKFENHSNYEQNFIIFSFNFNANRLQI